MARANFRTTHLLPRWKPTNDVVTLLEGQGLGEEDTAVLDLLSNAVMMGSDESGMPAYLYKDTLGYHIPVSMERAPTGMLKVAI